MDDGYTASRANVEPTPVASITPRSMGSSQASPLAPATAALAFEHAPSSNWSGMLAHAHVVQFYEEDAYLLDAVGEYIATALLAGEAAVIVATKLHRDGIEQRLRLAGLDVDAAQSSGQFVVHDALETLSRFMVAGAPDPQRFDEVIGGIITTSARGRSRVRVFGGMVALLVADGSYSATLELERLWNDLQRQHPFTLFCAYPMDHAGGEELIELFKAVNAVHTHIIPAESYTRLSTAGERLRAVADLQQQSRWLAAEIAQRAHVEERLRVALATEQAARQEAELALRQRDEFLSIAAHELRTPLTSLSGQAQLALRRLKRSGEVDPARMTRTIEVIAGQADRLRLLLNQLLDVSRLEAGKLALDPALTDLTALVSGIVATIQPSTDQHQITMTAPAQLHACIDPLRIEQVVTNLLDNAIKYSPHGGEILVTLTQPTPDAIELAVRDHGVGISPDKQARIFERFYQAQNDDHTSGLGLGLYISRQIVELHGGQISAEHPDDDGVCFRVRLPIGQHDTPASGRSSQRRPVSS